ncbi:MAG: adenylate/guanylate cyclase domain-containing protein [Prosthecobacter sp.]
MKFFSTFRAKLILSIFPIVAGVVIGALLLFEWKFSATYQHLFEEQFENQIAGVTQAKKKRFEALSTVLEKMALNPEVISGMKTGDFMKAAMELRPALETLAQERLQNEFGIGARAPGTSGLRMSNGPLRKDKDRPQELTRPPSTSGALTAPFIALLDSKGNFVLNQRPRGGSGNLAALNSEGDALVNRKSSKMPWLSDRPFADILTDQQVGYLIVEAGERRGEQVREVFVTPLRDPVTKAFLGAFVFGLPITALAERTLFEQTKRSEFGEIMGGIFVEGKLVSTTVPENQKDIVAHAVTQSMTKSDKDKREVIVPIAGVKHRLIYRVLNPESPFPQAAQVNFFSLAPLQAEITDLRRSAIVLGIFALSVALLLISITSRSLSGPVSQLVTATQEIERGNFDVRVPVTPDELGRVSQSFNEMAAGLALQEKYRSVLNAVADRTVAERLIENREVLSGELRDVTMLFCDIRGFTALTEHMPPHEVIELLNEHMTALTEVSYAHGGIVDKFVGDLIMVLFGAPISGDNDALRAVQCARAMMQRRRELNATSKHPLEVGIGLASGSVVAGCMGSDQRLSYTVLGHRVNLASRLCGIAQAGEIIVDAETASAIHGSLPTQPLPPMQLKGFSGSIEPHRIVM